MPRNPKNFGWSGSTGERNDLRETLRWCHGLTCLAKPAVRAPLEPLHVLSWRLRQVGALGQILAAKPVGVLVRPLVSG